MGKERPRVVFNSRTGTVVMGQGVKVRKAAVSHGSLTVTIGESQTVSQPNAFSNGRTTTTPNSQVQVDRERNNMFVWPDGTSLEVIVKAVNSPGRPRTMSWPFCKPSTRREPSKASWWSSKDLYDQNYL